MTESLPQKDAGAAPAGRPARPALKRAIRGLLSSAAFRPAFLLCGFMTYLLIRLLEPWRRVQVDMLEFERIGHLMANTEKFLRASALDGEQGRRLTILLSGPPANRQLVKMIGRRVWVVESSPLRLFFMIGLRPFLEGTRFGGVLQGFTSNPFREFNQAPPQLSFLPEEKARGQRLAREMGVPDGMPWVCLHARDSRYLLQEHAHHSREDWAYHDFRNCGIDNYLPAAARLAAGGLAVLRMGHTVERRIKPPHPLVIDYATRYRSDFGDIYLIAHSKFFLGSTAGLTGVAYGFDVPVALANVVPIGWPPWHPTDLFILKRYWDVKSKRFLTFPEIIAAGGDYWNAAEDYAKAGVEVVENTAEEIAELAVEMNSRLDGTWVEQAGDQELQDRFRGLFPPDRLLTGYPSRVGAQFLRNNRDLLE